MGAEGIQSAGGRRALVAARGELAAAAADAAAALGFTCHRPDSPQEAIERVRLGAYDLVVIAEDFDGEAPGPDSLLEHLARLPMAERRNALTILIGPSFRTLDPLQAYAQSVHMVVNPSDAAGFPSLLEQGLSEFETVYRVFRQGLEESGEMA